MEKNNLLLLQEKGDLQRVALDNLFMSPLNTYALEEIDELADSLRTYDVLTPLTVIGPNDKGCYEILSGARRFSAAKKIYDEEGDERFKDLPCNIVGGADMDTIVKQLVIEVSNLDVRDVRDQDAHRFQVVALYHSLAENGTIEQQEITNHIIEALKVSPRYARMYCSVFKNAEPELKQAVLSGLSATDRQKSDGSGEGPVHIKMAEAARASVLSKEGQLDVVRRTNAGENVHDVINENREKENLSSPKKPKSGSKKNSFMPVPDYDIAEEYGYEGLGYEDDLGDSGFGDDDIDFESMSGKDFLDYIEENSDHVDQNIDTTGEIKKLLQEAEQDAAARKETERSMVRSWLKKMFKVDDTDSLEAADKELLDEVLKLAEHFSGESY